MQRERVWEIDAFRGLLILCLLAYHLYYTVEAFCINGYYTKIDSIRYVMLSDPLQFWFRIADDGTITRGGFAIFSTSVLQPVWVDTFFVVSGISCMFSRNNLKRGLKTLAGGLFIAAFTYGLKIWTGDPTRFIRFGALMCYASCQLIYVFFLEKKDNDILFFVGAIALGLGYYLRYHGVQPTRLPIFYIFGVRQIGDQSSDYWPILPMLGWFLVGVVAGRRYYKDEKTLLPYPMASKITKPLQWLGRHSGELYIGHIVLYTVVFCGIGYLFNLY